MRFAARHFPRPLWALVLGTGLVLHQLVPKPLDELLLGLAVVVVLVLATRMHRALGKSERSYKDLVERLPLVTYVDELNAASTTIYVSPQVEQLLGYPVEAWHDDPEFFPRILHPDDRERVLSEYPVAGGSYRSEYRLVASDGRVVWVQDDAVIGEDATGKPSRQGFLLDITERKASEADRQQLAAVVASSDDAILSIDLQGVVRTWNAGAVRMYGYTPEEAIGRRIVEFAPPEREGEVEELLKALTSGEHVRGHETVRVRKDGERFDVSLTLSQILDEHGNLVGFSGIVREITEQKRSERRLAAEHAVTRAAAEASTLEEGAPRILQALCESLVWEFGELWCVDDDEQELVCMGVWHTGAESLEPFAELALTSRFARGRGVTGTIWERRESMVFPDFVAESFPRSGAAEKAGLTAAVGFPIVLRNRCLGVVSFFSREAKECDEALYAMMESVATHIGQFMERIRAEERRQELEEQLRHSQKMEAIGRLAGGVAHDFNNSLMAIRGYSELMLGRLLPGDPLHRHADGIKKAADSAAAMTKQLLAFGRKQMLRPEVLDLNDVVLGMAEMIDRVVGSDVELETSLADDLGSAKADPQQFQQVLLNLVLNARDAMPDGGKLLLETANVELEDGECFVMLAVTDTGCGMDRETQAQIFEPFFTTKELGKGSGLGLATVYGIVDQSDGRIWVESDPGRGTTFRIHLPRIDRPTRRERDGSPFERIDEGSETVLVVEDEASVRTVVCHMLQERGYEVIAAATAEEAILSVQDHPGAIDLLLTDVVMPSMNGAQLAERLTYSRPGLKVLYMSGYTNEAIGRRGVLEDSIFFLEKPFTSEQLARRVREVLDGDPEIDAVLARA